MSHPAAYSPNPDPILIVYLQPLQATLCQEFIHFDFVTVVLAPAALPPSFTNSI
jgi:hypothetical protein